MWRKSYEDRLGEYPGFLNLIESVKPSQCTLVLMIAIS